MPLMNIAPRNQCSNSSVSKQAWPHHADDMAISSAIRYKKYFILSIIKPYQNGVSLPVHPPDKFTQCAHNYHDVLLNNIYYICFDEHTYFLSTIIIDCCCRTT